MSNTPMEAYEFDLEGNTNFTGTMTFTKSQIATIELVHTSLEKPIPRCNFEHEVTIANSYTQEQFRGIAVARRNRIAAGIADYNTIIRNCLCPQNVRETSPLCAHASEHFEPSPYANELKALMHLRIIQRDKWTHWFTTFMIPSITNSDSSIASNRYDTAVNTPEWRQHLQNRDERMLEPKRVILLKCTQVALQGNTIQ